MTDQSSGHIGNDQINIDGGDYVRGNQDKRQGVFYDWNPLQSHHIDPTILDEARRLLASLPLDYVPDVATSLPPGSRMSLSANPLFVGRDDDLQQLAQLFQKAAATGRGQTVAITGIGGLGKTQLAAEFVHRYGQFFDGGVFWLSFASPDSVPSEIAICGGAGGLNLRPDFITLSLAEQVRLVQSAWQSPLPRLLIFENCEDQAILQQWRPPSGGCSILITSRRANWDAALGVFKLAPTVLDRQDSITLLRNRPPIMLPDDPALVSIADELGDLPLALHVAGSFLVKYRTTITPTMYLDLLRKPAPLEHRSLQGVGLDISPTKHDQNLARTFSISYERLDSSDPTDALALQILARLACFAPGVPLPRALLQHTLEWPKDDPDSSLQFTDAVLRLVDLGLLETETDSVLHLVNLGPVKVEMDEAVRLHRLLVAFVRSMTIDPAVEQSVEKTVTNIIVYHYNMQGDPVPLLILQPHLRVITDRACERMDELVASLCNNFGSHLRMIGDYTGAQPYHERALAIHEQVLGSEDTATAVSMNNLGMVLKEQGAYASARPYLEQALAINKRRLDPADSVIAGSLNNLGGLLGEQGDYIEACSYYKQALAIYEEVLGLEHPDTTRCLNNLGDQLLELGDYIAARPLLEQALAIRQKVLSPMHPDIAQSLNNLGVLFQTQGEHARSQPLLEQALAIREQVLGPEHPDTAQSLNNVGLLREAQGNYAEAQMYFERALTSNEQVLGMRHPNTARSLNHLGQLFNSQGDYEKARTLLERALAIREQILGVDHPDTATSLNNLGSLMFVQGDYDEARSHCAHALAICLQQLGPKHPTTQMSRQNLRVVISAQNTAAQQIAVEERALKVLVDKALTENDVRQRMALAARIKRRAQQVAVNQVSSSPYYLYAVRLRKLAKRLR